MKSGKTLAQQIAKQIAQEPLEILKTAKEQTTGIETPKTQEIQSAPKTSEEQSKQIGLQNEHQDRMKSSRRMEALNRELEDIEKQDVFKDLQRRISEDEEIPLEDYPSLSLEQKQVLLAQIEAVKTQKKQAAEVQEKSSPPFVSSRPGRRFGPSRKQEAEKQQTHVEKPVPPSG